MGHFAAVRTNRVADPLGLGPLAVTRRIQEIFGDGVGREAKLAGLKYTEVPNLEMDCRRHLKIRSEIYLDSGYKGFDHVGYALPGAQGVFLECKYVQRVGTSEENILASWKPSGAPIGSDVNGLDPLRFAVACIAAGDIAGMLETPAVLSIIERLLAAIPTRYLDGILELPSFWLQTGVIYQSVVNKILLRIVSILQDLGLDSAEPDRNTAFDIEGVDFLGGAVLVGVESWLPERRPVDLSQHWYKEVQEVIKMLRKRISPNTESILPRSWSRATTGILLVMIPTVYNVEILDILVVGQVSIPRLRIILMGPSRQVPVADSDKTRRAPDPASKVSFTPVIACFYRVSTRVSSALGAPSPVQQEISSLIGTMETKETWHLAVPGSPVEHSRIFISELQKQGPSDEADAYYTVTTTLRLIMGYTRRVEGVMPRRNGCYHRGVWALTHSGYPLDDGSAPTSISSCPTPTTGKCHDHRRILSFGIPQADRMHELQKCDSGRPTCNQCRLRPPRTWAPCSYPLLDPPENELTSDQMLEAIRALKARVEELELIFPPDPLGVPLNQPYMTASAHGKMHLDPWSDSEGSHSIDLMEPPPDMINTLLDLFLARFAGSSHFFHDPVVFRHSVLLPLPFGDRNRPAPALLCAAYLWGSTLADIQQVAPYTPDAFLLCCLQNLSRDLEEIIIRPQLILQTIQAQVLVSLYYMHTVKLVQGRYYCSAAVSLALGARLHLIRSSRNPYAEYPAFTIRTPALQGLDQSTEAVAINALWAVVILNNSWAGVDGAPSSFPWDVNMDTPWPSSTQSSSRAGQAGPTILAFLNGDDSESSSHLGLLSKASVLLERVIALGTHSAGCPDPSALEARLDSFQAVLPALTRDDALILAHSLADSAIVRLHAPHAHISAISRSKCFAAAARIVATLGKDRVIEHVEPVLAYRELDGKLSEVMSAMAALSMSSPIIGMTPPVSY
ncbi:hypothetical protein DFH09DRAFT_1468327 [Mycena vulgaris]|nr:hypothetical protein DFH09DRAFT_1468327 [Mycena vulgaris]